MKSTVWLAHHWLVSYRGGERVLEEFATLFPSAPIATLVAASSGLPRALLARKIIESPFKYIPGARKYYRHFLALHPFGFGALKVDPSVRYLVSSDAAMVKGVMLHEGARHVCYCHSPPRYLWGMAGDYTAEGGLVAWLKRTYLAVVGWYSRPFDWRAAQRVDLFIANSRFVSERIYRCYGRNAAIVYPPVAIERFTLSRSHDGFYLVVSQLTPYKRVDIAIEACNMLGRRLVVIGTGSELGRLRKLAGPTVNILGWQAFESVKLHLEACRAFLHPQIEDFGIAAVEAQACGKGVIAFGVGGACESIIDGETGLFFRDQTGGSLAEKILEFESGSGFVPDACRANAERFSRDAFRRNFRAEVEKRFPDLFAEAVLKDPTKFM